MTSSALGHQEDEETIFEYTENKNHSITIDQNKGRKKPNLSEINIYMGGSKTKLGAGSGFVIMKGKSRLIHTQSINLPTTATIFQAELRTIREACSFILTIFENPTYIKIYCDSQAALKALANTSCKANTVKQIHDLFNKLSNNHRAVRL